MIDMVQHAFEPRIYVTCVLKTKTFRAITVQNIYSLLDWIVSLIIWITVDDLIKLINYEYLEVKFQPGQLFFVSCINIPN